MVKFSFSKEVSKVHSEICRRCLNDIYGARLRSKQCLYDHYMYNCSRCGAYSHIVRKVTLSGYLHLMLRRKKVRFEIY